MKGMRKDLKWKYTLFKSLLFWLICIVVLAISSRLTKGIPIFWSQILTATISAIGAFVLTILFVRWEKIGLKDVGVLPSSFSISRLSIGFIIGLFLAALQVLLVSLTGHLTLVLSPEIGLSMISINLLLYIMVALREELAFRGYPLRSLNYVVGPWMAQLFVAIIFILEHALGGMTWPQAILGSGTGALLFGLAALKTKGIALPIGLHTAWNFGQWFFGFKNETGFYNALVEKGYEVEIEQIGMLCYLLIMGLGMLSLYYWRKLP